MAKLTINPPTMGSNIGQGEGEIEQSHHAENV